MRLDTMLYLAMEYLVSRCELIFLLSWSSNHANDITANYRDAALCEAFAESVLQFQQTPPASSAHGWI
jgi:hypothetical protein